MYITLLIITGIIGLIAFLSILGLLWFVLRPSRKLQAEEAHQAAMRRLRKLLFRWTLFDYLILLLFLCSMVFLAVDLAAVIRDREAYPLYHYGYLASGFIFSLVSMLLMVVRLGLVLTVGRASGELTADDHIHPTETDQTEHGVQG